MKKPLLMFLVPTLLMLAILSGVNYYETGALPGFMPEPKDIAIEDLNVRSHGVRVHGWAHYPLHLKATVGETIYYVYPLFPEGNSTGRDIHVLVRSLVEPDPILGLEDMVVEGLVRPLTPELKAGFKDALLAKGYTINDDALLIDSYAKLETDKKK